MNNVIFTKFGDSDPCCHIGDIWVQCDNPTKAKEKFEKMDKYRWHDLRKDPNDLPEKANDDSKSGYSKEVLIISSLFNEVWLGYMKLSDKKWFDSVDGELLSKPVMWKYIELPDEKSVSKDGGVKMKYRIKFNGWIEINRDNAEEAYDTAESKLRNVLRPLEHNDGVSEIDIYDFEAEECD